MVVVAQRVQKAAGPTRTEKQGEGAVELVCLGGRPRGQSHRMFDPRINF